MSLQRRPLDQVEALTGDSFWRDHPAPGVAHSLARMRFEVGDVLASVPMASSNKDAYLLSAVLHGFNDDSCVQALRIVAQAAAEKGATIVLLEMVMPDQKADLTAASFDLQMFMGTPGCERTRSEWDQVFERAGVRLVEIVHLSSFGKMLVLQQRRKPRK
jgi:hypothetical protein